jgi:CheY-like chemotaxis protein
LILTVFGLFDASTFTSNEGSRFRHKAPDPAAQKGKMMPLSLSFSKRRAAEAGYTPLEAPDGATALALLRAHDGAVRAVVTDAAMPRMDGAALAEHIRMAWPELPLVVVSGHPLETVTRGGGAIAAARFLQKPFPPERLLEVLADVVGASALRGRQPRVS